MQSGSQNAKHKREQDKDFAYYVTPTPQRLSSRYISNSDEEIHTGNSAEHKRAKKSDKKHKHSTKAKDKEPNAKNRGTPNAGTPKKQEREPESDGPRARPENACPTNAVSTPLPGTSKINPNASIDHLAELVRGLKDVDPVPHTDNPRPQERTLDTSELDMGMTVEVENDLYVGGNLFDNTTAPIPTEQETLENVCQECLARELDLAMEIESFRRRAEEWSEDLRHKLERRGRPGPAIRNKDLRGTRLRKSGPSDLRYSKLKARREKDLRNFIKPKRRTSSASPVLRTPRGADSRGSRDDERRQVINKLKSSMTGIEEKKEEESDTSESSESNEEGEVEPSEDELMKVRYSESDTPTRTPIPGLSEARLKGDPNSGPKNQKKGRHISRKEKHHTREPKPGPSGARNCGPTATTTKSESKKPKRVISPIKFPDKTPTKSNEEVPLSKLAPRVLIPPPILDLREDLNLRPSSSKPKIDGGKGPIKYRINCDFPPRLNNDSPNIPAFLPWIPGNTPINNPWLPATQNHMKWRTSHSNRPFIVGNTTSRNDGTMTGQEEDEAPEEGEDEEENESHDPNGGDDLTAVFFETGAMPTPTKSRNLTNCG